MDNILEIKNLHFKYGETAVLHGISLNVKENEIVTILGGNGAGKSTTLNAITGIEKGICDGEIWFCGERIDGLPAHVISSKGIAYCFEGRRVFSQLTVLENLKMGAYLRKTKSKEVQNDLDYVYNLFPILKERSKQMAGTLSGGEQQMLALARALMQKPKLLLLDEPSLGLAPIVVEDIFKAIKIISKNIPILLVEQNSVAALGLANRGYVMETGNIVLSDSANNLLNNEQVQKSYMGIE